MKVLQMFLFLSPFLYGGFFEWAACAYSVFLIGYLLYCGWKAGALLLFTAYGRDSNGIRPLQIAYGDGRNARRRHHFVGRRPCGGAHGPVNSNSSGYFLQKRY